MSERPADGCLTHRPPRPGKHWQLADRGYRTCSACFDQLRAWLAGGVETVGEDRDGNPIYRPASIPGLYALLDSRPNAGGTARRGPGFGSRSPASDHVITMTDPRSKSCEVARDGTEYVWDPAADHGLHLPTGVEGPERPPGAYVAKRDVWYGSDGKGYREQSEPPRSVPGILASWALFVTEGRALTAPVPRDVPALAELLDRNLDWVTRQEWVADLDDDLRDLHRKLRATTGDGGQPPVGHCIELLANGECGAPIYMPAGEKPRAPDEPIKDLPTLRCPVCDTSYSGSRLIRLKLASERAPA